MPCLLSLNVTNSHISVMQMSNDHFPWTELDSWGFVFRRCVVAGKERSASIIHVASGSWHLCQCCYQWTDSEGQGVAGMPSPAPVLLTLSLRGQHGYGLKVSKMTCRSFFPGQEPHRHTVEAGHWSRSSARGVWLQPPAERKWTAEAAGAARKEEAAAAPGAGEGPAGAATARWGNGRVRTTPGAKCPAAVGCRTSWGYTGTCKKP